MGEVVISCGSPPSRDIVELAKCAERLGYHRYWSYDSPALYGDLWVALARIAEATDRINIGTAVAVISMRHPLVTASAILSIEELGPGRLACAFGAGFTARKAMGQKPSRWSEVCSYVDAVQRLLRSEVIDWEGAPCQMLHAPHLAPPRPVEVPILLAPGGPRGMQAAREFGAGLMVPTQEMLDASFEWCAQIVNGTVLGPGEDHTTPRVREAAGPWFTTTYHAAYDSDPDAVLALPGGAAWRETIESARPERERHLIVHEGHVETVPEHERPLLDEAGPLLTQLSWTGDEGEVRARIEASAEAGADEIVYMASGPDIPRELEAFMRAANR
ncbi:LLM class flavin-dependent oxidoreductase [Myxococcota bacterium]|nr:LLM class flavin-dependent oxidoreductase [Myxococcota bacterium]